VGSFKVPRSIAIDPDGSETIMVADNVTLNNGTVIDPNSLDINQAITAYLRQSYDSVGYATQLSSALSSNYIPDQSTSVNYLDEYLV
jgi:hypothetical protein